MTPFLPGDSLLFVAGALAATGGMDIKILIAVLLAAAVIGDGDLLNAARKHINSEAPGAGVNGVFHQFLDDAHRPFNDLSGRDHVRGLGIQFMNSAHSIFIILQIE